MLGGTLIIGSPLEPAELSILELLALLGVALPPFGGEALMEVGCSSLGAGMCSYRVFQNSDC
jgi:hypothetical protein